jgi:hypothetical protein
VPPERVGHVPCTGRRGGLTVAQVALVRVVINVLAMKRLPWQVRETLWIGVVGPPVASLVLLTTTYLPLLAARSGPIDMSGLMVLFIFFAVPFGYVFGVVPALLAGAMYSRVLTAMATRRTGTLLRACLAAICGGLVCGIWFHVVAGPDWRGYAAAAALVAALLSLRSPRAHVEAHPMPSFQTRAAGAVTASASA